MKDGLPRERAAGVRRVVLDTNVFVAAGFNAESDSAWTVEAARTGTLEMIWCDSTRAESELIIRKIPPLDWNRFVDLFQPEQRYDGPLDTAPFAAVPDADDRKFAALAHASGSVLITMDEHLLSVRDRLDVPVRNPGEYRAGLRAADR